MRRAVPIVFALGLGLTAVRSSEADDDARATLERLALENRWDEFEAAGTRTPATSWAWRIRDAFWRPSGAAENPETAPVPDGDLAARRARWADAVARGEVGPIPAPNEGQTEPWPVLTALVADRMRRLSDRPDPHRSNAPDLVMLLAPAGPSLDAAAGSALNDGLEKLDAVREELDAASASNREAAAAARARAWWHALGVALALVAAVSVLVRRGRRPALDPDNAP